MSDAVRKAKVVSCPACGASITLRALGQSVMVSCASCQTQLDVSRPYVQIIRKYRQVAAKLRIPLGTRGNVRGQMFEVVGAMERSVQGYRWQEYLLFNPYIGFRWLVSDAGHWSFGRMVRENLTLSPTGKLEYQGRSYRKFQSGKPKVEWVVGEFYWRVAAGDTVKSSDYIAPPFMLSLEKTDGEFTWTQLEYIESDEIDTAFGAHSQDHYSILPNQPNPFRTAARRLMTIALAALTLAIVIQLGTALRAHASFMPVGVYSFQKDSPAEQVYGPFTFDAPFSLNELVAQADLDNSWVELDCSLVNTATGEIHEFTNAFSYYYGYDSDGRWTEGNQQDTSLLTTIPAGTYNLVIEGASGDNRNQRIAQNVRLSMIHDVVPWRNFWFAVLMILAYPVYLGVRSHLFEKERWADSELSPYSSD
jgi:hypothetical protein